MKKIWVTIGLRDWDDQTDWFYAVSPDDVEEVLDAIEQTPSVITTESTRLGFFEYLRWRFTTKRLSETNTAIEKVMEIAGYDEGEKACDSEV